MGIYVGTNVYPLPVTDTDVLVINQGLVPVEIGTMRDNLASLGMTLQPLASLILGGRIQYYAVAPTAPVAGVELDFIEGGSAFAPSPQQVVSILNSQTLANQIGAAVPVPPSAAAIGAAVPVPPSAAAIGTAVAAPSAAAIGTAVAAPSASAIGAAVPQPSAFTSSGARLVDPSAYAFSQQGSNVLVGQTTPTFDLSGSLSFLLRIDPASAVTQTTIEVGISWYDAANTLITSRVYEWNAAGGVIIQDRCLGAKASITFHAVYGSGAPGSIKYIFYGSSRTVDTNRILGEGGDTGGSWGFDGTLLRGSGTLAFGTGATRLYGAVSNGRAFIHCNLASGSTGGPVRFRFWHGLNTSQAVVYDYYATVANINVQENINEIILPPRPLICDVLNLGTSGSCTYSVDVWTDPNSHA